MRDPKPIPVDAARIISEQYEKSFVIINAFDPFDNLLYTATYGVTPKDKAVAARLGEVTTNAIGGNLDEKRTFSDFRRFKDEAEEAKTLENIETYAGGFVKLIGTAYLHGDPNNRRKLLETFWNYFKEYLPEKWKK